MVIEKEFRFEMAHKLSESYTAKCQHIHGHSYKLKVQLFGEDESSLNDEGVLADFTFVKEIVKPYIEKLDHNFMIHAMDKAAEALMAEAHFGRYPIIVCKYNPTAERICLMLLSSIAEKIFTLCPGITRVGCVVEETETSSASYSILKDACRVGSKLVVPPFKLENCCTFISNQGGE